VLWQDGRGQLLSLAASIPCKLSPCRALLANVFTQLNKRVCLSVCLCLFLHMICGVCYRSLSSKVISQHTALMSPMAVDAVLRVIDPQRPNL